MAKQTNEQKQTRKDLADKVKACFLEPSFVLKAIRMLAEWDPHEQSKRYVRPEERLKELAHGRVISENGRRYFRLLTLDYYPKLNNNNFYLVDNLLCLAPNDHYYFFTSIDNIIPGEYPDESKEDEIEKTFKDFTPNQAGLYIVKRARDIGYRSDLDYPEKESPSKVAGVLERHGILPEEISIERIKADTYIAEFYKQIESKIHQ